MDELRGKPTADKGLWDVKGNIVDYVLVIVGFGLCRAWIVSCLSASIASVGSRTDWVFLLAGAASAALTALVLTRFVGSLPRMHEKLTDVMTGLILGSAVCIPAAAWLDSPTLLMLGVIIGGAGAGLLQVTWGERFAAQNLFFSLTCAPAAAIVTGIVLAMSSTDNQLTFVVLPILSLALLVLECKRCKIEWKTGLPEGVVEEDLEETVLPTDANGRPRERVRLNKDSAKLMISIMVFSFLVRAFDAFPVSGDDPFAMVGGSGAFSLVIVGAIFLGISFLLKDRMNVSFVYRLSLPIMIGGLIAIALIFEHRNYFSVLAISIGYELFDILSWVLFSEIARRGGRQAVPYVFGIGVAYTFIGMAAGYVLSAVLSPMVATGDIRIGSVALIAILCLVIIAFMVLPESAISSILSMKKSSKKVEAPEPATETEQEPAATLEEKCCGIAEECGLTPREEEVLAFLARGRTLNIVARDLHIAKNTARTHIEKIYQKTDIHKQQELIDYVEAWEPQQPEA
ncbi:helix-turn-helix domain-containing protein [Raoultibacter phocaeensis]|uniref:helix-turn-helix domain-containing protein n=1 Tax=Raoultibacter phocaeensis TaxID=2479841 RepID=UPI001117C1DC|nr:helix-turn-helix transcriptional regulator [Raoultibacter phocaeensis]